MSELTVDVHKAITDEQREEMLQKARERKREMKQKRQETMARRAENEVKEPEHIGIKEADKVYSKKDYVNGTDLYGDVTLGGMVKTYLADVHAKRQDLRESKEDIRYFPSSVGQCLRKTTYQMLHYHAEPKKGDNLSVLENGTAFHNRMENTFKDMGILIAPELSLKDKELCISGRSDAIVWNFIDDPVENEDSIENRIQLYTPQEELVYVGPKSRVLIIELKSIKDKKFHKLSKKKPLKEHEMQLQLYFYLTGIDKGIILYENKNSQETKEYIVEKDDKIIESVLKEIKYCVDLAKKHELAPRTLMPTDVQCRYCDYRDICWPEAKPFTFEDLFELEGES